MAEIKVEKKRVIWPWIVAAAVLVALLIFFLVLDRDDDSTIGAATTADVVGEDSLTQNKSGNSPVVAYVDFIEGNDQMSLDHAYTNEALQRLVRATQAVADNKGYDVNADLNQVNQYAEKIQRDSFATTHADAIRSSADILTSVLRNIQQAHFSGLSDDLNKLKDAAGRIDPAELTLDQRDAVKGYFKQAADVLRKMNSTY